MIYTVTFNPAIDYLVHLPGSLALGQVNRTVAEEYQFGGKGINVSESMFPPFWGSWGMKPLPWDLWQAPPAAGWRMA